MDALTIIETNNLVELEQTISRNLKAFYEVGEKLLQMSKTERSNLGISDVEEMLIIYKNMKRGDSCLTLCK